MMGCFYVNGPWSDNVKVSDSGHPSDDGHGESVKEEAIARGASAMVSDISYGTVGFQLFWGQASSVRESSDPKDDQVG